MLEDQVGYFSARSGWRSDYSLKGRCSAESKPYKAIRGLSGICPAPQPRRQDQSTHLGLFFGEVEATQLLYPQVGVT